MVESLASCEPCRQCRVVRHPPVDRFAPNRIRLANRLLPLRRIDDQVYLVVLDHVHDMRPALTLFTRRHAIPASLSACAVPSVASTSKPRSMSLRASPTAPGLSRSRTLIKHTPLRGSVTPEAACAFA